MKLFTVEERKELLEKELDHILEVLKRDYEPEKIMLFGSLADGDIHEWRAIAKEELQSAEYLYEKALFRKEEKTYRETFLSQG